MKFKLQLGSACIPLMVVLTVISNFFPRLAYANQVSPNSVRPIAFSWTKETQYPNQYSLIYGLRVSALSSRHLYLTGIDFGPFSNNELDGSLMGIQLGYTNKVYQGYGLQFSIWESLAEESFKGIQLGFNNNLGTKSINRNPPTDNVLVQFGIKNFSAPMIGLQAGLYNHSNEIHGVQIGLLNLGEIGSLYCGQLGMFNGCSRGIQAGLLNDLSVSGLQFGGFNIIQQGLQFGVINYSTEHSGDEEDKDIPRMAFQVGLMNTSSKNYAGVQLGPYNYAGTITGVQIGIINLTEQLSGVQLGLINIIAKPRRSFPATAPVRVFPIINWSFG